MSQTPHDPNTSPEKKALQSVRFAPKEIKSKDERTQRLDSFLRTLGPEKADKPSDTTSQKNNGLGSDTLNGRKAKDDIGVSYDGLDSLQNYQILRPEQKDKGFDVISSIMDIDNRLNKAYMHKLSDDYMKDRGVDPKEFRDAGKKLHKYLKDALNGDLVSIGSYERAYERVYRMAKKLGNITRESPF